MQQQCAAEAAGIVENRVQRGEAEVGHMWWPFFANGFQPVCSPYTAHGKQKRIGSLTSLLPSFTTCVSYTSPRSLCWHRCGCVEALNLSSRAQYDPEWCTFSWWSSHVSVWIFIHQSWKRDNDISKTRSYIFTGIDLSWCSAKFTFNIDIESKQHMSQLAWPQWGRTSAMPRRSWGSACWRTRRTQPTRARDVWRLKGGADNLAQRIWNDGADSCKPLAQQMRNEMKELGCAFLGAFGLACSAIQIWRGKPMCMHACLILDDSLKKWSQK